MKNNLKTLTGIVGLITILLAGGCSDKEIELDCDEVLVVLKKAYIQGEKMHLEMYNSYAPKAVVVDSLYTDVVQGGGVYWIPDAQSGIKKIKQIGPKKKGKIFEKNARKVWFSKKFKLKIPDTAEGEEKYDIRIKFKDGSKWDVDPYLRIPEPNESE